MRLQDTLLQDDSTTQGSGGMQDIRVDEGLAMTPDTNTSNDEDDDDNDNERGATNEADERLRKKGHMCMFCGKIYSRR